MSGLYLHIPFCKQACHYCDFHFSTQLSHKSELVNALSGEMKLQRNYLGAEKLHSVYLGGGTPSLLSEEELVRLFQTIHECYFLSDDVEITAEANPDDLTEEKLLQLKSCGVNRLSIGIQTFDDKLLHSLNRAHNREEAITSYNKSLALGISNISIDLMYGIPGQTFDRWKDDVQQALALNPNHISAYSLTIEEKTAFGRWAAMGKLHSSPEDEVIRQMEWLMESLETAGYDHYEVSNFSKPKFQSRHNSNYWCQGKYLGIGPGAHSYNSVSRQYNIANNNLYIKSIKSGEIPFTLETLTAADKINEYLLTSLRTKEGCDLHRLKKELNFDLAIHRTEILGQFKQQGLIIQIGEIIQLTKKGILLADFIAAELFE